MNLYNWQEEIINHEGNLFITGGRQTGKTEAVARRIKHLADKHAGCKILIIAAGERQEDYLYDTLKELYGKAYKYRKRATKNLLPLKNGTNIWKFPEGRTGKFIEGMSSVDFLFADEAVHIGERVWNSVMPMLLEPRHRGLGWITLLTSTQGKRGRFLDSCLDDEGYKKFKISSEDVAHADKAFLENEKKRLTDADYRQIYGGEWVDETSLYFKKETIDKCMSFNFWKLKKEYSANASYYLGIDPARFGKDKAAFVVVELLRKKLKAVYCEQLEKSSIIELVKKAESLHKDFNFRGFYYDDGGVGGGFDDMMQEVFKGKCVPLNNSSKGERKGKILKEDLYSNLIRLMEQGDISMIRDEELRKSMESINFDYDDDRLIISGSYDHLCEALGRACWCMKERKLRLFMG